MLPGGKVSSPSAYGPYPAISWSHVCRLLWGVQGANQAVAAANLGGRSQFICMFGSDAHASSLWKEVETRHVSLALSQRVQAPSGQAYILLQSKLSWASSGFLSPYSFVVVAVFSWWRELDYPCGRIQCGKKPLIIL